MPAFTARGLRCCRCLAGLCALGIAALPALASATVATGDQLKRSDKLDVRRIGKATEAERSVLRIEWRAGMSDVDADRSLADISERIRQMESGVAAVREQLRSMPARQRPADPIVDATPAEDSSGGIDWRLMAANVLALFLVGAWFHKRRKERAAVAVVEAQLTNLSQVTAEPALESAIEKSAPDSPTLDSANVGAKIDPLFDFDQLPPSDPEPTQTASPPEAPPALPPDSTALDALESVPAVAAPEPSPSFVEAPPPVADPTIDTDESKAEAPAAPEVQLAAPPEDVPPLEFELELPAAPVETREAATTPAEPVIDFSLGDDAPDPADPVAPLVATVETVIEPPVEPPAASGSDPTLHMAEIMLSMGLEQGASQALLDYSDANPQHAIHHMLKLLGIYRKRGMQQEFLGIAERLRKNYNIQAADWSAGEGGEAPTLEGFPRVAEHVQAIWSRPAECTGYLAHLIEDNREGARAGFPQSVAEEILLLIDILRETSGESQVAG